MKIKNIVRSRVITELENFIETASSKQEAKFCVKKDIQTLLASINACI